MKGIIVDLKGRHAVAMNKQGEFIKIKNNGRLRVGYEVDIPENSGVDRNVLMRVASIAAVFLVTIGLGFGAYSYAQPYSYVDIDINPSVEITTNIFDRIIGVEGLNEDGNRIVSKVKFKHKNVAEGIRDILDRAVEEGYIQQSDDNAVMLTISGKSEKKIEYLQEYLKNTAVEQFEEIDIESEVLVEEATIEKHDSAKEMGISPGKLEMINELVEISEESSKPAIADLKNMSVKDIRKAVKEIKKKNKKSFDENIEDNNEDKAKDNENKGHGKDTKDNTIEIKPGEGKKKPDKTNGEDNIKESNGNSGRKEDRDNNNKNVKDEKQKGNEKNKNEKGLSNNTPGSSKGKVTDSNEPTAGNGMNDNKKGPNKSGPDDKDKPGDEKNKGAPDEEVDKKADKDSNKEDKKDKKDN